MDAYEEAALAFAQQYALTWQEVAQWTYQQCALASGVELGPGGESPGNFFYRNVRRAVSAALRASKRGGNIEIWRTALRDAARLIGGMASTDCEFVDEDEDSKFLKVDITGIWEAL